MAVPAGVFLPAPVPPPVTPFLIVPITVLFAAAAVGGGFGCAPGGAVMGRFRITVDVLPSLDSLVPLALRAVRVAGRDEVVDCWEEEGGAGCMPAVTVAPRLRAAAVAVLAVVVVAVVVLRAAPVVTVVVEAVGLWTERAPSTILLRMLVARTARPGVTTGRAMPDRPGVATVRGATRELEVVGERTWVGLRVASVVV